MITSLYPKKAVIYFLALVFCCTANAQRITGSFTPLRSQARVKLVINFSEANIMGMNEEEFSQYEEDWTHDKVEVISLFYSCANEVLANTLVVGNYTSDTDYILRLDVRAVDVKGNYDSDLVLIYNGEVIAKAEGFYTKGGTFGSKLNLMKDGAEHTGTAIGKFLLQELSLKKKRRRP